MNSSTNPMKGPVTLATFSESPMIAYARAWFVSSEISATALLMSMPFPAKVPASALVAKAHKKLLERPKEITKMTIPTSETRMTGLRPNRSDHTVRERLMSI